MKFAALMFLAGVFTIATGISFWFILPAAVCLACAALDGVDHSDRRRARASLAREIERHERDAA